MNTIEKKYLLPETIYEASRFAMENQEDFTFISGGTDVWVNAFQGTQKKSCIIDLSKINELKGIEIQGDFLRIGSAEILEELKNNDLIKVHFPLLIEAALSVGSPLIRKTATIGGNILCENRCLYFNQSEWWRESVGYCLKCDGDICIATGGKNACFSELVSDTAPALITLNAKIEYVYNNQVVKVDLEEIYTGDGVYPRNLPKEAILLAIYLPLTKKINSSFFKLRERESMEFTSLTFAATTDQNGNLKIALSGVDPKPVVYSGSLNDDSEQILKKLVKAARSVDNDMYSRVYRKEMIKVYLERALKELK
ncbi:MAG: FAD binding domain-containing protein [Flavobacteriia bacterium]|nr:FAD binding domain-containing protein [Flavobacteriia bacterium]